MPHPFQIWQAILLKEFLCIPESHQFQLMVNYPLASPRTECPILLTSGPRISGSGIRQQSGYQSNPRSDPLNKRAILGDRAPEVTQSGYSVDKWLCSRSGISSGDDKPLSSKRTKHHSRHEAVGARNYTASIEPLPSFDIM